MSEDKIKILEVSFDKITLKDALNQAIALAKSDKQSYITTPNPEILLEAQKNKEFLKVLNESNLNIADGTGILWASKYLDATKNSKSKFIKILKWIVSISAIIFYPKYTKTVLKERVTGTDLMQKICEQSSTENLKIFLLGASEGIAEKAKETLEKNHPRIKITGTYAGTPKEKDEKTIIEKINSSNADILFIAYGAPNQELWIAKNLKKLSSIKLAIGVGGAFDFISGTKKRAPILMQKMGLEWLYRLIIQPSRTKRIYNATIKFPIKILIKNF